MDRLAYQWAQGFMAAKPPIGGRQAGFVRADSGILTV
jgi:hypothetical protein